MQKIKYLLPLLALLLLCGVGCEKKLTSDSPECKSLWSDVRCPVVLTLDKPQPTITIPLKNPPPNIPFPKCVNCQQDKELPLQEALQLIVNYLDLKYIPPTEIKTEGRLTK